MDLVLYLFVVLVFIPISYNSPDKAFWFLVLVISDPGGYLTYYTPDILPSYMTFRDLIFPLLFLPLLSPKTNTKLFWMDKSAVRLFKYLIFFMFYQILVFGWIIPQNSFVEFLFFIFLWKYVILSVFLFVPAYIFTIKSLEYFIKLIIFSTFIILILYLITITTSIKLVPIWQFERFNFSQFQRIAMFSYGYMQVTIFLTLIVFVLKAKMKYKKLIYFSGAIMFIVVLLTLTRSSIISTFVGIGILMYLMSKYLNIFPLKTVYKVSIFMLLIFLVGNSFFSENMKGVTFTFNESYLELIGEHEIGTVQSRTEFEMPRQIAMIKQNPLFGTGYKKKYFAGGLQGESLDANDTSLIGMWAIYGIIGTVIYLVVYVLVWKNIFKTLKYLRYLNLNDLGIIKISFFLILSILFLKSIVFPNAIFLEVITYYGRIGSILNFGILYGISHIILNPDKKRYDS